MPQDVVQAIGGRPRRLKVGGITPFTATDYPGQLSTVIFVQGCPWRCGYCHNPHLQARTPHSPIPWDEVLALLERRRGLVDAVVFSGGEPTMDPGLASAIGAVRALGFKIGLHSGGTHPERLKSVLPMLDWVGFDVKTLFGNYARVTKVAGSGGPALAGLQAILASGVDYECRTTLHPALLPEADIIQLAQTLADLQVKSYALQVFREQGCSDAALNASMEQGYPSAALVERVSSLFPAFTLRRG
ncbi:anaerobic ribonucleoside-triphosphate reductase activating protein [Pusillimonas sp. SM2304]|uniref:anaerobic ribonucleoside-triphosphate reductase activating protein n=1 Tax=Pusillimonas sp. SM2304 TaxID=3073241 RepID=UPI0028762E33|nr:anaerobic ribonucleoside-triphosphate reductase activating protein [Pusillimonas sp. SM2304]MDS1141227.1 anaerobic ribonucleoside-triphosphate reductase activating protein [Pusillimonas sp. SM2304]